VRSATRVARRPVFLHVGDIFTCFAGATGLEGVHGQHQAYLREGATQLEVLLLGKDWA
jgi:hypothetical protein